MWKQLTEWCQSVTREPSGPRVLLGEDSRGGHGITVLAALGDGLGAGSRADAVLIGATSPERLRAVVRFCAQESLPVDAWLLSGLWHLPARIDKVARFVRRLAADAGRARVCIDTRRMPTRYRNKLVGHLRRCGCNVD